MHSLLADLEEDEKSVGGNAVGDDDDGPIFDSEWKFDQWSAALLDADQDTISGLIRRLYRQSGGDVRYRSDIPEEQLAELVPDLFDSHFSCNTDGSLATPHDVIIAEASNQFIQLQTLYAAYFRKNPAVGTSDPTEENTMLNTMFIRMSLLRDVRTGISQYIRTFAPGYRISWSNNIGFEMCLRPLVSDMSDLQKAIDHCLFAANAEHLRHIGSVVYEPIFVKNELIKAYKPRCTMMDFVTGLGSNIFSESHKILSASKGLVKSVVEDLTNAQYDMFPQYSPHNEWLAFDDGMLHIFTDQFRDEFFAHGASEIPDDVYAGIYHPIDLKYDQFEQYRGTWENPQWQEIPCALHKVTSKQFPPGTFPLRPLRCHGRRRFRAW